MGRISKLIKGKDNVNQSAKEMSPSKRCSHRALKLLYPIEYTDKRIKTLQIPKRMMIQIPN